MKLCREELSVIKDAVVYSLEPYCESVFSNAKELAYLSADNFSEIDTQILKWSQLVLRKVINKMVEINGS